MILDGGGTQTRDFIEVRDVARANRLAIESTSRNKVINIGSGKTTSIIELAQIMKLNFSVGPSRTGDALTTEADIASALEYLGWQPEISLEKGIRELFSSKGFVVE